MQNEMFDRSEIINSYFEDEIKTSYLNYAYSVITGRAIPNVYDGVKPVQRRILYSMSELGLWSDKPTKKSARIVGEVMGKYHPHGDASIYMAMVKMAQDFSMRYPLIIGQGNFGSIDDDPPAAMRYTEAKLSKIAEFMLEDLDKDTCDFKPNFDDTMNEPTVLPGKFPNLLCNGSSGIAVGLATDVPSHNYTEIAEGIKAYLENPAISIRELMNYIKGPDFPTGGIITNREELYQIYNEGTGSVELAGKIITEEKGGHLNLVITEIPFKVIKSKLVEEITNIYLDQNNQYAVVLKGIKEIRDESSKEGIRIVIELYKDANIESIKTALYKLTSLKVRIKVNMTGLVNNHPRTLNLKELIENFVNHRRNVIIRRTKFDLDKAQKRIHIVEGLLVALANIDEVIKIIKSSKDTGDAKNNLTTRFLLTEIQAEAILDMKLQKLTNLEVNKLKEEKNELEKLIKELKEILASEKLRDKIIAKELDEMKTYIGKDERKTIFEEIKTAKIDAEELIENDPVIITVSKEGFIFREIGSSIKISSRGNKGKKGDITDTNRLEENDYIFATLSGYMKDTLLFVSNTGRVYSLKVYEIYGDTSGKTTRAHIKNIDRIKEMFTRGEKISAVLIVSEFNDNNFITFITKKGKVARIPLSCFSNINRSGINSIKLKENDDVVGATITDGKCKLLVIKKNAKGFKIDENLFPVHNRGVSGEKGTSVSSAEEEVLGMCVADENRSIVFISRDGRGRKLNASDFSELVNRGGKGYKLVDLGKNRYLASFTLCNDDDIILITTKNGRRISIKASEISKNLLKLININANDEVSSISVLALEEEEE